MVGTTIVGLFGVLLAAFVFRLLYLVYQIFNNNYMLHTSRSSLRTILCIGSGGHTTEILRIMKNLNPTKYQPRLYIVADNDVSSEVKIHKSEQGETKYMLSRIPRSRNVKQSYWSSVSTTLYATLHTLTIVFNFKPDIILCNGPGTCIPVCVVAFLMRLFFILDVRIVFVESICRVQTLSLTGKILQCFADVFVVQWPQLLNVCIRAKYFGRLT